MEEEDATKRALSERYVNHRKEVVESTILLKEMKEENVYLQRSLQISESLCEELKIRVEGLKGQTRTQKSIRSPSSQNSTSPTAGVVGIRISRLAKEETLMRIAL